MSKLFWTLHASSDKQGSMRPQGSGLRVPWRSTKLPQHLSPDTFKARRIVDAHIRGNSKTHRINHHHGSEAPRARPIPPPDSPLKRQSRSASQKVGGLQVAASKNLVEPTLRPAKSESMGKIPCLPFLELVQGHLLGGFASEWGCD